jgi:hypothetical protein
VRGAWCCAVLLLLLLGPTHSSSAPPPQLSPLDSAAAILTCAVSCALFFDRPLQAQPLRAALAKCLAACPMLAGRCGESEVQCCLASWGRIHA